jgi:formylglycine-generating enzyme required for sulfatase activity
MKKLFLKFIAIGLLLLAVVVSCKDKVTEIKLNKAELALLIDGTATLTANLLPDSATDKMIWTTNNSNVAVVESDDKAGATSKGMVTAKALGVATITVSTKNGKFSATCTIRVVDPEPELIVVVGGTFTMGCAPCTEGVEGLKSEPEHEVTLINFKIAKYPVTQQQWEAVMGDNPSYFKGHDLPVEQVTWNNVQEFIQNLNLITGKNYRLPTEAEWEYAARGGNQSKGYPYSGSYNLNEVAWYQGNSNQQPHPVGEKMPNELGIYDMSGNVAEWCNNWFDAYTADAQIDPQGPPTGLYRIDRGGSWNHILDRCTVYRRGCWYVNEQPSSNLGFRLAHP